MCVCGNVNLTMMLLEYKYVVMLLLPMKHHVIERKMLLANKE